MGAEQQVDLSANGRFQDRQLRCPATVLGRQEPLAQAAMNDRDGWKAVIVSGSPSGRISAAAQPTAHSGRDGRGFPLPAVGVCSPRRRTGDAGIPGGEDRRRRLRGRPRLGARSGREAVQGRLPAAAQLAGGANDPRRLRRRRPGAGGVRRGDPGGALRHRAAAPRRTDPAAALAKRRHDVRAGGRDPRGSLPYPFTRRPPPPDVLSLRDYMEAGCGPPAACFRSTSPPASSP